DRQDHHCVAILALLRTFGAICERFCAAPPSCLGSLQSCRCKQWRRRNLARNLPCQIRRLRVYLQQHAALWSRQGYDGGFCERSSRNGACAYVVAVMIRSFGIVASLVASSVLSSNEGAAIGAAFAEIMNYAAVYVVSLLLALTSLLISRRRNRKWYVATVVGAAVIYVLLLVIIIYSNDFPLYQSLSSLYY